jgi:hypothetical protein
MDDDYILFGHPGALPDKRVTRKKWRPCSGFLVSTVVDWELPLEPDDVKRLTLGFCPREMEEKWFIYSEGPDAHGKMVVNMHRSWTGFQIIQLEVEVGEQSRIVRIRWESSVSRWGVNNPAPVNDAAFPKDVAIELCRWLLKATIPLVRTECLEQWRNRQH